MFLFLLEPSATGSCLCMVYDPDEGNRKDGPGIGQEDSGSLAI